MRLKTLLPTGLVLAIVLAGLPACGGPESASLQTTEMTGEEIHRLVADPSTPAARLEPVLRTVGSVAGPVEEGQLIVDYPLDGTIYPPELVPPTLLWHDAAKAADVWFVEFAFGDGKAPIRALVPGERQQPGEIDPEALGETNEVYRGTPYQQSAHAWTVPEDVWAIVKERSVTSPATLLIRGFAADAPGVVLSEGRVRISTSADPVGAPIFYRDVPLMPAPTVTGQISPLARDMLPIIGWRLRDISLPESRLLLTGMNSCANCHSFSLDGKTMGIDVDGPQGDKGAYAIVPLSERTVIDEEHVISWNDFEGKPKGHKTIGFLTQMSPEGRFAVTTLNESLHVSNFTDYKFLQVFYPTRGILAWHSQESGEMKALPGADDTAFVHCDPTWTPDGKSLVFARARARDPYEIGRPSPQYANDPNETRIRFDLYRMPFDGGRGGTPVPIEGASNNGMSNTFPKVSPDGKWIVFTQCKNGQLMRPDGKLCIVPVEGGAVREMRCNTSLMNSWHSFSPNSRWLAFSSKANTPYTQMFLTHIDEDGNDSPAVLVPNCTAANRAVNIPEFLNAPYESLQAIEVPAAMHFRWLAEGLDLGRAGKEEEAIAAFRKALERQPDFSRAHAHLGMALSGRGDHEEALRHLQKAVAVNPKDASAFNELGRTQHALGDLDGAIRSYRRALTLSPRNPYAHNNLGLVHRAKGEDAEAREFFQTAVDLDPSFVIALKNLGEAFLRAKRLPEAIAAYDKAVEVEPGDAVAHRSLGRLYLLRNQPAKAVVHLTKAATHAPDDVDARVALTWLLATHADANIRSGERAVGFGTEACKLTSWSRLDPLDVLAAAYAEAGKYEDAVKTAKRALELAGPASGARAKSVAKRLALYEAGKPFRQPSRPDGN